MDLRPYNFIIIKISKRLPWISQIIHWEVLSNTWKFFSSFQPSSLFMETLPRNNNYCEEVLWGWTSAPSLLTMSNICNLPKCRQQNQSIRKWVKLNNNLVFIYNMKYTQYRKFSESIQTMLVVKNNLQN